MAVRSGGHGGDLWFEAGGVRPLPKPDEEIATTEAVAGADQALGFYLLRVGLALISVAFIVSVLWPSGQEFSFFAPRDPGDVVRRAGEGLGPVVRGFEGIAQGAEDIVGDAFGFPAEATPAGDFVPASGSGYDSDQVPHGQGVVPLIPDSQGEPPQGPAPTPSAAPPSPEPTPTEPAPSPTPSNTPTPTPSDTPSPTPSNTPTPTPSGTPTPTPSDTPTPTPSDTPTPTPSDTPTPSPTETSPPPEPTP
jgi:hypothetical protein